MPLIILSCHTPYKGLQAASDAHESLLQFRPHYLSPDEQYYYSVINGRDTISGRLRFRLADNDTAFISFDPDSGAPGFYFSLTAQDIFSTRLISPRLNKAGILKTLRQDFELLLLRGIEPAEQAVFTKDADLYYRVPFHNGYAYYVVTKINGGNILTEITRCSRTRAVTTLDDLQPDGIGRLPGRFRITHARRPHLIILAQKELPRTPL